MTTGTTITASTTDEPSSERGAMGVRPGRPPPPGTVTPPPMAEADDLPVQFRLMVLALAVTLATMMAPTAIASAAKIAVRMTFSTTVPASSQPPAAPHRTRT